MFEFIDRDSFFHRLNPCVKLFVILAVTILISCSLNPVMPAFTIIISSIIITISGNIPFVDLLKKMKTFILIAGIFVFFMLLLKGIDNGQNEISLLFFSWSKSDFNDIICLGLRIVAIIIMSMGFVMTTRPNDLILSFILQLHVPYVHGYAGMAAYRFVPTFQDETKRIRLAQEIRGVEFDKGFANRIKAPFRLMVPMLSNAVRKGEIIAIAMESRGLNNKERTFYKRTSIKKNDIIFIVITLLLYTTLIIILFMLGRVGLSAGFSFK